MKQRVIIRKLEDLLTTEARAVDSVAGYLAVKQKFLEGIPSKVVKGILRRAFNAAGSFEDYQSVALATIEQDVCLYPSLYAAALNGMERVAQYKSEYQQLSDLIARRGGGRRRAVRVRLHIATF